MQKAAPLSGVRVLDLSRVLAGPWATQTLGDLGAQVLKVEHPVRGDDTRHWGPPYRPNTSHASYFDATNCQKTSIAADLTHSTDQRMIKNLAKVCDVLVTNFKVGGLDKYGLDFKSLNKSNPRLIYCAISGFGQNGPRAHQAGYDFAIQALGGFMSITGEPETPMKVGVAVTDLMTGMYATTAIIAALHHRQNVGVGQFIDLALFDVQVAMLANQATNYLSTGKDPVRLGNAHPNIAPYEVYRAKDHHMVIAVGNDIQFKALSLVLGLSDTGDFSTNSQRVANRERLKVAIESNLCQRTVCEWLPLFEQEGIPSAPINTVGQALYDAQTNARGMLTKLPECTVVSSPLKLSESPVCERTAPPQQIGQGTESVLRDILNYKQTAIDEILNRHSALRKT